jgi:probable O-glycosylation ligase (exosortase A-associated)
VRDVIVTLIVLGALPYCFKRPVIGLLFFSVLAYMRLQDLAWGFARGQRWSFYVAIVTFAGWVSSREKHAPIIELRMMMMLTLAALVGLGLFFARGPSAVDPTRYVEYVKIVFIAIFTTSVIRTREHLRMLVWVIAMCFAFYGVKSGAAGIVKLGNVFIKRGPGGMLEDNNDFALALAMSVPLLVHLGTSEQRAILRKGLFVMIPLTMITVVLTRSRGGTLSMGMMSAVLIWRSRNRLLGVIVAIFAAGALVALAPAEYIERIKSIKDYETEGSAASRLKAWRVAGRMIEDNPITGVGFRRFQMNYLTYEPNPSPDQLAGEGTIVAHNSYLQIWAECGTPAFLLYMGLLFLSLFDIWRVRALAKARYHSSWILSYCTMFEAVLLTFMLGSIFLNRAHFDLIYHYFAIVLVFGRVARQEMNSERRYPLHPGSRHSRGSLVAVERSGFGRKPRLARGFRRHALGPTGFSPSAGRGNA